MATAYLTRVVRFTAWHRYFRPDWSAERNAAAFGDAGREPPHGHDYTCTVTVRGATDPATGMVIDLGALDRILREEVTDRYDRRSLGDDLPAFRPGGAIPTGEMLCQDVWTRVSARLPAGNALAVVRVAEDATLWAEYRGES